MEGSFALRFYKFAGAATVSAENVAGPEIDGEGRASATEAVSVLSAATMAILVPCESPFRVSLGSPTEIPMAAPTSLGGAQTANGLEGPEKAISPFTMAAPVSLVSSKSRRSPITLTCSHGVIATAAPESQVVTQVVCRGLAGRLHRNFRVAGLRSAGGRAVGRGLVPTGGLAPVIKVDAAQKAR